MRNKISRNVVNVVVVTAENLAGAIIESDTRFPSYVNIKIDGTNVWSAKGLRQLANSLNEIAKELDKEELTEADLQPGKVVYSMLTDEMRLISQVNIGGIHYIVYLDEDFRSVQWDRWEDRIEKAHKLFRK